MRVLGLVAATVAASACVRDTAPALCPSIGAGDLVVTEIFGPQSPDVGVPPWIEIFNASGRIIDLKGLKIRFRKKDGSSEVDVLVRRSLTASAPGYVVLGLVPDDDMRPSFIDYGFALDFQQGFLPAAAIDVEACGDLIDRAVYDVLPKQGSHQLGVLPPNANDNDVPANWCDSMTVSGSPGGQNPPCQ